MINRFSSRREKLDQSFLNKRLVGAQSYDRIAGFFSSSIIEVAGENLENIEGSIRMVCNSQLDERDVKTAQAAVAAMRQEWCGTEPEKFDGLGQKRFKRLYNFLKSGKLEVRVLPDKTFGLIHGKAGVITLKNGKKTAFLGSVNESVHAWRLNYELLWEDDSPDAIQWVQKEFDDLWNHKDARNLAEFIIEDVGRIASRTVISSVEEWKENPDPASSIIELPIYRKELGLWEHQKYFIKLAFDAHSTIYGARFVLADMVGLGKTIQLAMAAQLMALVGNKPILILTPKTLIWQWQDEMRDLLDVPSAVWNGKQWIDEQGIQYPISGDEGIAKCPRRIGVVSYGLAIRGSPMADILKQLNYECIIVDEVHRARRRNLGAKRFNEKPDPNHLLSFLQDLGGRTKSMLLATATPVQLYPIEAWDLLSILASGTNESVLGNLMSNWRKKPGEAMELVAGDTKIPTDEIERDRWIRNPFPPSDENTDFAVIRRNLKVNDDVAVIPTTLWNEMRAPDKARINRISKTFMRDNNPFLRFIIRRTRDFLETNYNPETNEPYLKPVKVKLFGEDHNESIPMQLYLRDAYDLATHFCQLFAQRAQGSGFLKTLLLRRMGSSIYAGRKTAEYILSHNLEIPEEEDESDDDTFEGSTPIENLTPEERADLRQFIDILSERQDDDPKYNKVLSLLSEGWLERGCIVFSQYFDSIDWLGKKLSHDLPEEKIGIYAGNQRSGIIINEIFSKKSREELKAMVKRGEIRLLLGTDSASEGLNLQALGSLINLDLPWNPTRLEQRKGRIQRIGQINDEVWIFNMRYRDSVEDRVHDLLSSRLEEINNLFGQIPDCLSDVWVDVALDLKEDAEKTIGEVPLRHPFQIRYDKLEPVHWEDCTNVLDTIERKKYLMNGW